MGAEAVAMPVVVLQPREQLAARLLMGTQIHRRRQSEWGRKVFALDTETFVSPCLQYIGIAMAVLDRDCTCMRCMRTYMFHKPTCFLEHRMQTDDTAEPTFH